MSIQVLAAFLAYFGILIAIGFLSHRKQESSAEFIVGNRSLNFWLTALSAHASDMSAWLFMGLPSAVYLGGISQSWIAVGLALGMFMTWLLVARKIREATEEYDSYTLSTYFERRFKDHSGAIRIITALMTVIFLTCYLGAGLLAMGLLVESVFGINYYVGLTIAMVIAVSYTLGGGFITIAWTDLFQALFLLFWIIVVPVYALFSLDGGWSNLQEAFLCRDLEYCILPDTSFTTILTTLMLLLGWGLGYFGQPHIVTKFMGIKESKDLKKSMMVGMTWQVLAMGAAVAIGIVGNAYFGPDLANSELVFVEMVKSLFTPFLAGFILCAILAANISTMDSQILVCASVLSEDFYKRWGHEGDSQAQLVRASRAAVILISLIALTIAFRRSSTVLDTVLYAWSGLGCAFGPLLLMSLYYPKANRQGAIAGILVGGFLAAFWQYLNPYVTDLAVPAMIPGFFSSLFTIYFVSNLTSESRSEGIPRA